MIISISLSPFAPAPAFRGYYKSWLNDYLLKREREKKGAMMKWEK